MSRSEVSVKGISFVPQIFVSTPLLCDQASFVPHIVVGTLVLCEWWGPKIPSDDEAEDRSGLHHDTAWRRAQKAVTASTQPQRLRKGKSNIPHVPKKCCGVSLNEYLTVSPVTAFTCESRGSELFFFASRQTQQNQDNVKGTEGKTEAEKDKEIVACESVTPRNCRVCNVPDLPPEKKRNLCCRTETRT